MPIGPPPSTTAVVPGVGRPWRTPWYATDSGSTIAACFALTPSGTRRGMSARTTVASEIPPPDAPSPWQIMSKHRFRSLPEQCLHVPHAHIGSTATRSPTDTRVTSRPTSTTSAENSWPMMHGTTSDIGPWKNWCRSVPHSPFQSGRTFTSSGPGSGSGTSSIRMSPGP